MILLLSTTLLLTPARAQKQSSNGDPDAPSRDARESKKDVPQARNNWFFRGRTIKGEIPAAMLNRAFRQKMKMRQAAQERAQQLAQSQSQAGPSGISATVGTGAGTASLLPQPAWENLGPAPITANFRFRDTSGRVPALAVDQADATGNTVYVGGAYGGVWKSTNAANPTPSLVTWTPLYDDNPVASTLSVGAIALQPGNSNLILVGTGETNNAGDSYYGMGILRSTDGGSNWTLISTADSGAKSFKGLGVSKFAFSTANPNFVVAAVAVTALGNGTGLVPIAGSNSGLYWSSDAGATWHSQTSIVDGATPTDINRVFDVVYNPTLNKFFAAVRYHGFYSSTDGQNWTRMTNQPGTLTTVACPASPTSTNCPMYRGSFAVKPGVADMYAVWTKGNDTFGGVFRTLDGGATAWAVITTTGITNCGDPAGCGPSQGFYNQYIATVPNGTSTDLYVGFVNMFKCSVPNTGTVSLCNAASGVNRWINLTRVYGHFAGGSCTTAAALPTIHPDQHAVGMLVSNPNIMYFGNDGGVYRTLTSKTGLVNPSCATGTPNTFDDLNTSSLGSLSQFVAMSEHPSDPTIILGGTQDNGSPGMSTADGQTSGTTWAEANGGDGGFNQIDQTDPRNWYTAFYDVSIYKCVGGTQPSNPYNPESSCILWDFFNPLISNTEVGGDGGAFYTPYMLDPANQSKIIVGTCQVWRGTTTPGSTAMAKLSNKFSDGTNGICGSIFDSTSETAYVSALAAGGPSTSNGSQVIYAGTDNGHVFVTTNVDSGVASWNDRTGSINPSQFTISSIALDPSDATGNTAYLTIMGFTGNPNGAGHVFKTTNATDWTDIGVGLPDSPADVVAVDPRDPNTIYVGTDVGMFITRNGGGDWEEFGTGFPNTAPTGARIFNHGGILKLRVATHGRGVWQIDLPPNDEYNLDISNPALTVYPGGNAAFNGTLTAVGSYSSTVALSCTANGTNPPASCASTPGSQTPTGAGAAFTVNASDASAADYSFFIHGVGTDSNTTTHDTAVTLQVIDFQLGAGTNLSMLPGATAQTTFALQLSSNWPVGRAINGTCAITGAPIAGLSCLVTPASRTSNGNFTLQMTTTSSTPSGTYTVTVTATDSLNGAQHRQQPITVVVNRPPDGFIDSALGPTSTSSVAQGAPLTVKGWAIDNEDGAPVTRVQVRIDGVGIGDATLGFVRSDVASYYGNPAFTNSGWRFIFNIPQSITPGNHNVDALAYDSRGLTAVVRNSPRVITVLANTPPDGFVDKAVGPSGTTSVSQGTTLSVSGWAIDQQDGAPVARVQVRIDGVGVGDATLGFSRPDVATYYGNPAFTNSGWRFSFVVPVSITAGSHNVDAVAYDTKGATTVLRNTPRVITVTTNSPPDGYLDSALGPTNTSTVPAGTVLTVKGWAADLEDGAPVTKVEVRIDGIVVGNATLGFARNDVATYYGRPAWTNSGWQFQTTPSLSSGPHTVDAVVFDSKGATTVVRHSPLTINVP